MDFWRFSRFVHADFGGCILQPEIETEGILDEGTKREQRDMDSVRVCMQVCMLCVVVCTGRQVLCGSAMCAGMVCYAGICVQVRCAMQDGQAGRRAGTGNTLRKYALCD